MLVTRGLGPAPELVTAGLGPILIEVIPHRDVGFSGTGVLSVTIAPSILPIAALFDSFAFEDYAKWDFHEPAEVLTGCLWLGQTGEFFFGEEGENWSSSGPVQIVDGQIRLGGEE